MPAEKAPKPRGIARSVPVADRPSIFELEWAELPEDPTEPPDCRVCGACCAFSADWPELCTERDRGPEGPPPEWVTERGTMRCDGDRCVALVGEIGVSVRCAIYDRRPDVCRDCARKSESCRMARKKHGLP